MQTFTPKPISFQCDRCGDWILSIESLYSHQALHRRPEDARTEAARKRAGG